MVPALASFVAIKDKGRFFNFKQLFEVWLLFQVPQPITWQKYLPFLNAEFNSASIDTSCKKFRRTIEEIAYYFLLVPLRFSANLIKFTFSVFPDYSGCVAESLLVPVDGEKLGGTLRKNQSIPAQELFRDLSEEVVRRYGHDFFLKVPANFSASPGSGENFPVPPEDSKKNKNVN